MKEISQHKIISSQGLRAGITDPMFLQSEWDISEEGLALAENSGYMILDNITCIKNCEERKMLLKFNPVWIEFIYEIIVYLSNNRRPWTWTDASQTTSPHPVLITLYDKDWTSCSSLILDDNRKPPRKAEFCRTPLKGDLAYLGAHYHESHGLNYLLSTYYLCFYADSPHAPFELR